MIEEHGTTDFAGALLRCFVSQGVMLGHKVFIGAGEAWGAQLPGLTEEKKSSKKVPVENSSGSSGAIAKEVDRGERMKIAWRYERLGAVDVDKRGAYTSSLLLYCISCSNKSQYFCRFFIIFAFI